MAADKFNFISERGWRVRDSDFPEFPLGEAFDIDYVGGEFVLAPKHPKKWPRELRNLRLNYIEGDELDHTPDGKPGDTQFETDVADKQRLECEVELDEEMHELRIWVITKYEPPHDDEEETAFAAHKRIVAAISHVDGEPVHPGHVHADD